MTVRILGIELEPQRGVWPTVTDRERGVSAQMFHFTRAPSTEPYCAMLRCERGTGWTIDGPYAATPELAAEALHATIRKLAEMEAKK